LHFAFLGRPFAFQKVRDRAAEARIGDEMRRPGRNGGIAAGQLVPALCAGLDPRETARDRKVDGAVIA
jgi:hypothetical protein